MLHKPGAFPDIYRAYERSVTGRHFPYAFSRCWLSATPVLVTEAR